MAKITTLSLPNRSTVD